MTKLKAGQEVLKAGQAVLKAGPRSGLAFVVVLWAGPVLWGQSVNGDIAQSLERLKSGASSERIRAEAEILRAGAGALPTLARELGASDRIYRLRAERLFLSLLDGLLFDLDNEHTALTLDRNELEGLKELQKFAKERKGLLEKLEAARAKDPKVLEKRDSLLALHRLEAREKLAASGQGPELNEESKKELERLRAEREEWRKANPSFDEEMQPLLRLARLEGLGSSLPPGGADLTELEQMRLKELEERVADRAPRLEKLEAHLEELGFPAYNALLARSPTARERSREHYRRLVSAHLERSRDALVPDALLQDRPRFDAERHQKSLLWAFESAAGGPRKEAAERALDLHLELTVLDLKAAEPIVRDRAADELYLLGDRGRKTLEGPAGDQESFLRGLLTWRIRPRTYSRTGIDFQDFPGLEFREKRRRLFEYQIAAESDALPTLRAIVMDDSLEPSFQVKLAAAKAMVGLRDMSGYNFLIVKHPDLTLKKPEVSREILIIQGNEHLRDKNYERAVEDLQKVLDELPFDFQANYYIAFTYLLMKRYAKSIHHFEIARRVNPEDQLTLYNLACAYALHGGKSQEALEALEGSVKAGFDDYEYIEKDPDLDSLRQEERYLRLLERMKGEGR